MRLPDTDPTDWLRLALLPGLGPKRMQALLAAFGGPAAVLAQPPAAIAEVVGPAVADLVRRPPSELPGAIERSLRWARAPGNRLVPLGSSDYPASLVDTPDPPPLLWVRGDPSFLSRPAVAVVGSRHATASGRDTARAFGRALADAGLVVVSGLARGIDAAAHEGALDGAAGTVAVLGGGVDRVYPAEHAGLAERVAAHGAVVSEAPLGAGPTRGRFPQRNRVIAGLSRGVLVVEAARSSGSLITAGLAADLGREVMAMPGSVHSPLAKGCHALLRDGAALVETVEDVLVALGVAAPPPPTPARRADSPDDDALLAWPWEGPREPDGPPEPREPGDPPPDGDDPLLAALGFDPVDPDRLVEATGLPAGALAARLTLLELDGRLEKLPDGRCLRRR